MRWAAIAAMAAVLGTAACSGDDASNSAFCRQAEQVNAISQQLAPLADTDQQAYGQKYQELVAAAAVAVAEAPSSIKAKMETQLEAMRKVGDIAKAHDYDFASTSADPAYQVLLPQLGDDPAVTKYLHDTCGLGPAPGTTG